MKKYLSLVLAALMAVMCISLPALADEERPVITIMNRVNAEIDLGEDNPIIKAIEDKLGIDIQYDIAPPSSYAEKEQIVMASGEMPDILYHHAAADAYLETWAADGIILPLDDYIPKYEHITAQLTPEMQEAFRANSTGKIVALTRPHNLNQWGFVINKTWLDNLGLKEPTTIEEFKDVMVAFSKNDPDGNGKDDTYGTTIALGNLTDYTNNGWAAAFGLSFIPDEVTGECNTIPRMTGYLPYLTYLHDLYAEGAIDPEWVVGGAGLTPSDCTDKFLAGKLGCFMNTVGCIPSWFGTYGQQAMDDYEFIAPMKNIYTGEPTFYTIPPMWGCYMINADSEENGKVDTIFELIDYCYSQEGWTLLHMGIEGMHYNSYDFENRTVDRTPEQEALLATQTGAQVTFCNYFDGAGPIISSYPEATEKYWADYNRVIPSAKWVKVPYNRAPKFAQFDADNPDANTHLHTIETQYIMGAITLEDVEAFLNNEYYPLSEEMNEDYATWLAAQWSNRD